jgi:hypothetical protein
MFVMSKKSSIFWGVMPYSAVKVNWCSSKMLVDFQWTTWYYIPEDRTLHNCRCVNLKSYIVMSNSAIF